jgi:hypothetical protein
MKVVIEFNLINFRMRAVIGFPSSGKGAFALRKKMKVLENTTCYLSRNPDNEKGEILSARNAFQPIQHYNVGEVSATISTIHEKGIDSNFRCNYLRYRSQ